MTVLTVPRQASARLSLRDQPLPASDCVDGGWWPRSRDLAVEFPVLLDLLWAATRLFTRISYHLGEWDAAPRKTVRGGLVLHFDGFWLMDPHLVLLTDVEGRDHLDLVVIPPEAGVGLGARALSVAGRHRDPRTTVEIVKLVEAFR
jgi:hypothetical protein